MMKLVLTCVAMSLAIPVAAGAQTAAPAAPAPATSTAPSTTAPAVGAINGDTPIENIMDTPAGKAALEKNFPDIPTHAAYEQFKSMSLRQLQPLAGGIITDEKITAFEAAAKTK